MSVCVWDLNRNYLKSNEGYTIFIIFKLKEQLAVLKNNL